MSVLSSAPHTSVADLLTHRAIQQPGGRAVVFLSDNGTEQSSLTYGELNRRALAFAHCLLAEAKKGDRAVLMMPTGPEFVIALFGCLLAGLIAVPIMPPRRLASRDSSERILEDCSPSLILTNSAILESPRSERLHRNALKWIAVDQTGFGNLEGATIVVPKSDEFALLQYTSGSTSDPKGVIVSHKNIMANLEAIRVAFGNTAHSTYVTWSPLYHDMGLVMSLLQPIYIGATAVLMQPANFVQRPMTWLRAIHQYQAEVAGAPNFAFELCVTRFRSDQMAGVDLSNWKVAYNGSEPVRAATLKRFAETFRPYGFDAAALYPCYGLAEATLLVSANRRGEGPVVKSLSRAALKDNRVEPPHGEGDDQMAVECGRPVVNTEIAIVDPDRGSRLPHLSIGEIWVSGAGVAQGYWRAGRATEATFLAHIVGEQAAWLRTGDLGFLDEKGALTITGRIKDVLIIRGMNHYPQDIEYTVQNSHPALANDAGAVFSPQDGAERIIVAQEVERSNRHGLAVGEIIDAVREAVAREHELSVQEVVLLPPGALPKTTSGKVQRRLALDLWGQGKLVPVVSLDQP